MKKNYFYGKSSKRTIFSKLNVLAMALLFTSFIIGSSANAQVTYCSPNYTEIQGSAHSISSVTINGSFQHNPVYNTHDYTSEVVSVDAGDDIDFSIVTEGWCGIGIAVDWNSDGDFDDADEFMARPQYVANSSATYDTTLAIPTGITSGTYRLRLWNIGANSGDGTPANSPCGTYNFGSWADYTLTILSPCTGAPTAGTLPSTMAVCPNVEFTLTPAGATVASGLTNQWQMRLEGSSTWTDLANDTSAVFTNTAGITDTVYYRYMTSCDATGLADTTDEIMMTINPVAVCYCIPGSSSSHYITEFTTTNAVNNINQTGIGASSSGYADLTAVDTVAQQKIFDFDFSFETDNGTYGAKVWIDWNRDGQFDNTEIVYQSSSYLHSHSGTITVPLTATVGLTRMRVGISYIPYSGPASACDINNYDYFQDYMFKVLPEPSCFPPTNLTADNITGFEADLSWTETGAATQWQIEYGTTSFAQGTGNIVLASNDTIGVSSLTPETTYDYYVRAICGPGDTSIWVGPFTFTTTASCPAPNALTSLNKTATTTDVSWTETGAATQWQVEYGTAGFTQGTGTVSLESNDTATVNTSLNLDYDFYVRAICGPGDTSAWSGPFGFHTGYCTSVPTSHDNNGILNIQLGATDYPGTSTEYLDFTTGVIEDLPQGLSTNLQITFGTSYTYGTNVWIDFNDDYIFEASELVYSGTSTNANPTTLDASFIMPVGVTVGNHRMRIGTADSGQGTPNPCYSSSYGVTADFIINVLPEPSCFPPIDLTINNLDINSAEIAWSDTTGASEWQVEWDTTGFVPGTGALVSNITDTFTLLSTLSPNTTYDYYVRTVCGAGDSSVWVGPYSFTTPCSSYNAIGFWESFEDTSETLACWEMYDANGDGDVWQTYSGYANSGSKSAGIYTDYNSGANDDYLISPQMVLTGVEAMKFSYRVRSSSEPNDFEVLLSTTGTNPADFTDTLMHDASYDNTSYKDTVVDLSAYTGNVYIAFHVPNGGDDGYYLYIDDVRFGECIPTPGTDGAINVCQTEMNVDLFSAIQTNNQGGEWSYSANPLVLQGNILNAEMMPSGTHDILYVVQGLCPGNADTTIAAVTIYPPSSAGENGTVTVCKNEPVDLFSALGGGTMDLGGTWYDPTFSPIQGAIPFAGEVPGSFNYFYVVSNTACPADTAMVNVVVDGTCDWLGIASENFQQLTVFPNPTSGQLTIENPTNTSGLKVVVYDMNGRVVYQDNNGLNDSSETTISLNRLDRGIYTLKLYNEEGQKVFKIVKK